MFTFHDILNKRCRRRHPSILQRAITVKIDLINIYLYISTEINAVWSMGAEIFFYGNRHVRHYKDNSF